MSAVRPARARLWRGVFALAAVGISTVIVLTTSPRLGLDLKGGTQIVLETQDTERVKADAESTDRALEVIRGRVDAFGVSEPTLARAGDRRIIVELPDVQDPREAVEVIGQTAQLSFHEVLGPAQSPTAQDDQLALPDESGQPLRLGPTVVDGDGVDDAAAEQPQNSLGSWVVNVDFNGSGAPDWRTLVDAACANTAGGQRIAIVLDESVISSPAVQPGLCAGAGGSTSITGQFSQAEAEDLAILIAGGALPVSIEVIEQRTVGATLGDAAIQASIEAAIIGIALTGLFIVLVYRVMGLMASIALGAYALISYGILLWLGATLTLPGLAGFILAIGLAIDANVLVFERAREEYELRPDDAPTKALDTGYQKAWSAILDSNVTTLLAAGLLFSLASGPVRGFGVTLSIGVIASMISGLLVARVLTDLAARSRFVARRPQLSGLAGQGRMRRWLNESGPFLMRRIGVWIAVAAAVAGFAIGGIVVRGLNLGVEFTGGRLLEFSTSTELSADAAREAVIEAGFPQAVVQTSSGDAGAENLTVRTEQISNDEAVNIERSLGKIGGTVNKERDELIGPSLGKELRAKAILAFLIAIGAQMVYLAVRFRWTYAAAAVISMAHVVLTVLGIFAWWGKPIDGVFLAAVLSIIGLAVNDTIVVFDRIRERTTMSKGRRLLREVVNEAILQTVPRTLNTGLGAMFILAALAVLGGDSLTDFAIALLLGLSIGIYSTIFTASPLAIAAEERWPQVTSARPKVADPYSTVPVAGRESGPV